MTDPERRPDADETRAHAPGVRPAESIGPYKLLQPLGEGGMGVVWLAEQARPVRRQVALKIIKAGMDTAQVVARFEAERQALALMDHPAIARVLDAGATPEGRPYFVMEYVRGEAINAYCEKHKLSTRDRIELFLQVCDGVQHAHQKGVIHRDLKPSNVLVTVQGDRAVPKIIDFGVAKATGQSLTDRTLYTELGAFVGTPEYMSPEQAEMSGLDIDTRSDVYSLGAILYELLTGLLPFDSKTLRAQLLDDMRRTIREVDPPKPSTRVPTGNLRGDLDWITMKALEKDRTRRYGSASDLAADLRRHLDNQPVLAGPPTATYRLGKFVRRHRAGVAVAASAAVLLVGFGATMAVQARRIARERDRATTAQAEAKAVSEFLEQDVLGQASSYSQADSGVIPDPDITVRTALDRAAVRIGERFAAQPLVQASLEQTLGSAYGDLGAYDRARQHLERALDLRMRLLGPRHEDTVESMWTLGWLDQKQGNDEEARKRYAAIYETEKQLYGARARRTLDTLRALGSSEEALGRHDLAEAHLTEALTGLRSAVGADDPALRAALYTLGTIYVARGMNDKGEPYLNEALASMRRTQGPDHPSQVSTLEMLAQVHGQRGDYAEAETLRRHVLAIRSKTLGDHHPATRAARMNLAVTLMREGGVVKTDEAIALMERVVAESWNGPPARNTPLALWNLAILYQDRHRDAEAEPLLRESLKMTEATPNAPAALGASQSLAELLTDERRFAEAEPLARSVLARRKAIGADGWERFDAESVLGAVLAGERRFAEAEKLLLSGYNGLVQRKGTMSKTDLDTVPAAAGRLAAFYNVMGKSQQAAEWRAKAK